MARTKRTDAHRPAAIIPAHYECVLQYSLRTTEDGWPVPSCGFDCVTEYRTEIRDADGKLVRIVDGAHMAEDRTCCVMGMRAAGLPFAAHGGAGNCTVCGARFKHGDVWRHTLTGEHIHLGYDCAQKYIMLVDRSEHELKLGRLRAAAAVECLRARKADERTAFLAKHAGLEEALKLNHRITQDIAARFVRDCELSDKQVALVLKLANEAANPKPAETHVDAPTGRVTFTGEVVSVKDVEGDWGVTLKMVVKVRADGGTWLVWVTAPRDISREPELRGCTIECTATLTHGKDKHFAFGKRPLAKVVARPERKQSA